LTTLGYDCGEPDGIFGKRTEAAVIQYQKDHPECGKPDGIIGKRTWASIGI
jgi:peptidoglycan hydrolase-like protein with peptidoglycan-binding domain